MINTTALANFLAQRRMRFGKEEENKMYLHILQIGESNDTYNLKTFIINEDSEVYTDVADISLWLQDLYDDNVYEYFHWYILGSSEAHQGGSNYKPLEIYYDNDDGVCLDTEEGVTISNIFSGGNEPYVYDKVIEL